MLVVVWSMEVVVWCQEENNEMEGLGEMVHGMAGSQDYARHATALLLAKHK
jgi:hypothetical protein